MEWSEPDERFGLGDQERSGHRPTIVGMEYPSAFVRIAIAPNPLCPSRPFDRRLSPFCVPRLANAIRVVFVRMALVCAEKIETARLSRPPEWGRRGGFAFFFVQNAKSVAKSRARRGTRLPQRARIQKSLRVVIPKKSEGQNGGLILFRRITLLTFCSLKKEVTSLASVFSCGLRTYFAQAAVCRGHP